MPLLTSRFGYNRIIPTQNLDSSSSVSFSTLQVQTVNGVNITAEKQSKTKQKQTTTNKTNQNKQNKPKQTKQNKQNKNTHVHSFVVYYRVI